MQIVLMAVLSVALAAAMISFAAMGLCQFYRARALDRESNKRGIHFSRSDPFDIPHLYRGFKIISCGHSPRACNVSYGQVDSWTMRAFDFRYEVGHGTRRMTCRYGVVVIDLRMDLPNVLIWKQADAAHAPLAARNPDGNLDGWSFIGNVALAETIRHAAAPLVGEGLSIQVHAGLLMLALPAIHRKQRDYTVWMDSAMKLPAALRDSPGLGTGENNRPHAPQPGKSARAERQDSQQPS